MSIRGPRAVAFERVRREPMTDVIIARIKEMLYQGTLQPGERLPSERELARQLGVGRPTVREAVRHLEAVGLLEVRPTVGIFVRSLTDGSLETPLLHMLHDQLKVVMQFVDTRIALEGWAAAEAARHATPEHVARLESLTQQMEALAARGESLLPLDAGFHDVILEGTQNPAMLAMREPLASLIASVRAFMNLVKWPDEGPTRATHHRSITDAIAQRDPERAQQAMVAHLRVLREALSKGLTGEGGQPPMT